MNKGPIPPQVEAALAAGNKIEAIKVLRVVTGLGLKEAKDWIESHERGGAPPLVREFDKPAGRDPNASFTLTPQAIDALKRGSQIEAIKIICQATGVGLAEAKSIVEEIQKEMAPGARFTAGVHPGHIPHQPRPGLGPGEVARGGGSGKWLALLAVGLIVVLAVLYF